MTLKNRAPLLCYFKLCASFHSHQWIQSGVTVWRQSSWVKIDDLLSPVILKFDGWPWKTIGHLFYLISSFVHHLIAIGEFKLELQSGNTQFGSKSVFSCPVQPWNLTDLEKQKHTSPSLLQDLCIVLQPLGNSNWSYSPEIPNMCQNRQFFPLWPLNLMDDLEQRLGTSSMLLQLPSHLPIQTGVAVRKCPNLGKICFDLCHLDLCPLNSTFCMNITLSLVITLENFMMIQ